MSRKTPRFTLHASRDTKLVVSIQNLQREAPVNTASMTRLARRAIRRLGIRTPGTLAIAFIGSRHMRALNKQFRRHDRTTDVLSFRYDGPSTRPDGLARDGVPWDVPTGRHRHIVGEILIAPRCARTYAHQHKIPYRQELSRYVVHGLLHWLGSRDGTPKEQALMRKKEDVLLAQCGVLQASDIRHAIRDCRGGQV